MSACIERAAAIKPSRSFSVFECMAASPIVMKDRQYARMVALYSISRCMMPVAEPAHRDRYRCHRLPTATVRRVLHQCAQPRGKKPYDHAAKQQLSYLQEDLLLPGRLLVAPAAGSAC